MVIKHKYTVLVLVIISILITNAWRLFPLGADVITFALDPRDIKKSISLFWFVQLMIYHIQFLLLLVSVFLLSLTRLIRYIAIIGIIYQLVYILDFILTYNYNETLPTIFAVAVSVLIFTLTKWKK